MASRKRSRDPSPPHSSKRHRSEDSVKNDLGRESQRRRGESHSNRDESNGRERTEVGKDRDRDRDRHRDNRHRDREKDRDRDKERSGDKKGDRERCRERSGGRDRDRDRDADRARGSDRDRDRIRERESDRDRVRDRDRDRDRERDRERESGRRRSRETHRDRGRGRDDRDRGGDRGGDRGKDREREKRDEKSLSVDGIGGHGNGVIGGDESMDEEDEEYRREVERQLKAAEESEEEILRRSRMRRQAVLEKLGDEEDSRASCEPSQAAPAGAKGVDESGVNGEDSSTTDSGSDSDCEMEQGDLQVSDTEDMPGSWFCTGEVELGSPSRRVGSGLVEESKDEEGYYRFKPGELIGPAGRYRLVGRIGKGAYSNVFRAIDMGPPPSSGIPATELGNAQQMHVAIKMLRHIDVMSKKDLQAVAMQELDILQKVSDRDPKDKYSCVRLLEKFEDKDHLCLVFEHMDKNLRELMHQYGKNIGLNIQAVTVYARRLAMALLHLKRCDIIHADFKLDNILVGEDRRVVKLADFGCASSSAENVATSALVSRYYRPPEVILGIPYGFPMDLWSYGCTLYEIYTGHVCFKGDPSLLSTLCSAFYFNCGSASLIVLCAVVVLRFCF